MGRPSVKVSRLAVMVSDCHHQVTEPSACVGQAGTFVPRPCNPAALVDDRTVTSALELVLSTGVSDDGSSDSHISRRDDGKAAPPIL